MTKITTLVIAMVLISSSGWALPKEAIRNQERQDECTTEMANLGTEAFSSAYDQYIHSMYGISESEPIVIALGFFFQEYPWNSNGLKRFAYKMHLRTNRNVLVWEDLGRLAVVPNLRQIDPVDAVEVGIQSAIERAKGQTSIFFRLDGFNVERAFGKGPPKKESVSGVFGSPKNYTTREVYLILSNREYFRATQWFLNDRELTPNEVEAFFGKYLPFRL
jgi:hypothetical protein